jgi:hypothetical protein
VADDESIITYEDGDDDIFWPMTMNKRLRDDLKSRTRNQFVAKFRADKRYYTTTSSHLPTKFPILSAYSVTTNSKGPHKTLASIEHATSKHHCSIMVHDKEATSQENEEHPASSSQYQFMRSDDEISSPTDHAEAQDNPLMTTPAPENAADHRDTAIVVTSTPSPASSFLVREEEEQEHPQPDHSSTRRRTPSSTGPTRSAVSCISSIFMPTSCSSTSLSSAAFYHSSCSLSSHISSGASSSSSDPHGGDDIPRSASKSQELTIRLIDDILALLAKEDNGDEDDWRFEGSEESSPKDHQG